MRKKKKQLLEDVNSWQDIVIQQNSELQYWYDTVNEMQEDTATWEQAADTLISIIDEMWLKFIYDNDMKRSDLAELVSRADNTYKEACRAADRLSVN